MLTNMPWARAVVREAGAIGGGVDGPALRLIGSVVDADGGDGAQIAQHPLHGAAGGDVDAVGVLTISQGGVGERCLAANAVPIDLATRHSGLGFDEDVTVGVRRERNGAGRRGRADRCRR